MAALFPLGIDDGGFTVASKLVFITIITFSVHIGLSSVFGLEEVRPFFFRVRKLIKLVLKPIKL